MKILSTFLLVLLLLLVGQPPCTAVERAGSSCCASDDCSEEGAPAENHSDDDADCHGCNPFQACACCAAAVVLPAALAVQFPAAALPASPVWHLRGTENLLSRNRDFWQPPRLG